MLRPLETKTTEGRIHDSRREGLWLLALPTEKYFRGPWLDGNNSCPSKEGPHSPGLSTAGSWTPASGAVSPKER